MERQNVIKVFKPSSKQADFSIRSVHVEAGLKKLAQMIDEDAATLAGKAYDALQEIEAESLVFFGTLEERLK